jgi:hypothetical protein
MIESAADIELSGGGFVRALKPGVLKAVMLAGMLTFLVAEP